MIPLHGKATEIDPTERSLLSLLRHETVERAGLAALSAANWQAIVGAAQRHQVAPLLYDRLKRAGQLAALPPPLSQTLRDTFLQGAGANMRRTHELCRVLRALDAAHLPIIALKGAHLADLVYHNPALRPMGDTDLLARESDLARVDEALRALGYQAHAPWARFAEETCEFVYTLGGSSSSREASPRQQEGLVIEIHPYLEPPMLPFQIDTDGLWNRSHSATIAGARARVLCPEDLLLHLALHLAARHAFSSAGLRSLYDIAETLRVYGGMLDWAAMQARARAWRVGNCLLLTLRLAVKWLGAPLPEPLLSQLEQATLDPQLEQWAEKRLFAAGQEVDGFLGLEQFWSIHGWRQTPRFFLKAAFPARQRMAALYGVPEGSWRIWTMYPMRLWGLLWARVERLRRRWQREPVAVVEAASSARTVTLIKWLLSA